jgi:exonuclease III
MKDRKIMIMGLAETRMKGKDRKTIHDNYELVYSGNLNNSRHGVAIILEEKYGRHIENITYESNRIIAITLNINQHRTSFVQTYAPSKVDQHKRRRNSTRT